MSPGEGLMMVLLTGAVSLAVGWWLGQRDRAGR